MTSVERSNVVDRSPHRDGIRKILASKHGRRVTYKELRERIRTEYGVDVPEGTLRWYVSRYLRAEQHLPPLACMEELRKRGKLVDVLAERADLIQKQKARVEAAIRKDGAKPSGGTREEVRTLSELLNAYRRDQLELGIVERAPERHQVEVRGVVAAVRLAREQLLDGDGKPARNGGGVEDVLDGTFREVDAGGGDIDGAHVGAGDDGGEAADDGGDVDGDGGG